MTLLALDDPRAGYLGYRDPEGVWRCGICGAAKQQSFTACILCAAEMLATKGSDRAPRVPPRSLGQEHYAEETILNTHRQVCVESDCACHA